MDEQELAFHASLDESPRDWAMRLVYSDWLEEQGRTGDAIVQRWIVGCEVAPVMVSGERRPWVWDVEPRIYSPKNFAYVWVSGDMVVRSGPFGSRQDAESELKRALLYKGYYS